MKNKPQIRIDDHGSIQPKKAAGKSKGATSSTGKGGTEKVKAPTFAAATVDAAVVAENADATRRFAVAAPFLKTDSKVDEKATAKLGPRLLEILGQLDHNGPARGGARASMDLAESGTGAPMLLLPISAAISPLPPSAGESWKQYKERVMNTMGPLEERLRTNAGLRCQPVFSANSMQTRAMRGQIMEALKDDALSQMEIDLPRPATLLDDVRDDIEIPVFRLRHPTLDGSGIVVAVLDSGVDTQHPWLRLAKSISVQGQDVDIPGSHATHVAGIIGSQDSVYSGVAPGARLLNIRILDSQGRGQTNDVGRGIDAALDEGAQIINLSVGFNHRPRWSDGGHGHTCSDERGNMCMAVDNALTLSDGAVAVLVAAGNEHQYCEFLQSNGNEAAFDTELCCPGHSRFAVTVGAITKQTFETAPFSSRGPTAYGKNGPGSAIKPNLSAPGVNITSAALAPRDAHGGLLPNPTRAQLSRKDSGTSMATPVVSGVAALILQGLLQDNPGLSLTQLRIAVRDQLLTRAFRHLGSPDLEVGIGRITLGGLV